jgi:hypothetical protein
MVASQARVNVDAQGSILSVFNTADGSGNKPAILNVYCGDVNIPMTPAIQANLETISPLLDWSQGGVIYSPQVAPLASPTLPHPQTPILPPVDVFPPEMLPFA